MFVMGELLPGLWLAEFDLLILLCANYPHLSWKKMEINDWHYAFKQKISRLAVQGCLTVNYPPHSLLWSIGHTQISMRKFCLDTHSSHNKIWYTYEKETNQHPLFSAKANTPKSSYLYSDGKPMTLVAIHKEIN